jgi:hypothetical protein
MSDLQAIADRVEIDALRSIAGTLICYPQTCPVRWPRRPGRVSAV